MEYTDVIDPRYPSPVPYAGRVFPSAENAFQASKRPDGDGAGMDKYMYLTPDRAAYDGARSAVKRQDWEDVKYAVMDAIMRAKFSSPAMMAALIKTRGPIVFRNMRHDQEWGVCMCRYCRGRGENRLGRILENIRDGAVPAIDKSSAPARTYRVI